MRAWFHHKFHRHCGPRYPKHNYPWEVYQGSWRAACDRAERWRVRYSEAVKKVQQLEAENKALREG